MITEITEQTKVITDYIGTWMWHLFAWLFFLKSLGYLVTHRYIWFFGLMGVFIICEMVALDKKLKLEKEIKNG